MSLKAIYERFLTDQNPSPDAVSPDVSLNYITTTTTFNQAGPVTKHLSAQKHIVKDVSYKTLNTVEGPNSLCLDIESTLEFVSGGGAYLPELDDNFISDRTVTFPTVHIVHFDAQQKINQIRIYWDQGSLLKQVDVIGSRGRTWPIRDARDQLKLLQSTASAVPVVSSRAQTPVQKLRSESVSQAAAAQNASPSKKHIKDPHSSLSLFSGQAPTESHHDIGFNAPKSSAKPTPRDYGDLFVGGDPDATPTRDSPTKAIAPKGAGGQNYQPSRLFDDRSDDIVESGKANVEEARAIAPKAGSGQNYKPSRLFGHDGDDTTDAKQTLSHTEAAIAPKGASGHNYNPSRLFEDHDDGIVETRYKSHPQKYNHFEFGNGEDGPKAEPVRPASKHASQWNFEDFVTPEKPRNKVLSHETRHFGWSDDEGELAETPPQKPRTIQPRRDAEPHFQFQDEATPVADKFVHEKMKGSAHNNGLGLYENNLYDDNGVPTAATEDKAPLTIMPNGVSRMKDFDSHWTMTDTSPAPKEKEDEAKQQHVGLDRMKAVKMMDSSWDTFDETAEEPKQTVLPKRASRNVNQRSWGFGDDGDF